MNSKSFDRERGKPVRIIVHGASGRVGARLVALIPTDPGVSLAGALTREDSARLARESSENQGRIAIAGFPESADVVIDFSSDDGAKSAAVIADRLGAALLIGTTALSKATVDKLAILSRTRPVLVAPNTSIGVAAMDSAVSLLARMLGSTCRASLVEAHHDRKKDAPSGTALRLASTIRDSGGALSEDQIFSIRAGDIIGEHTVRFAGPGEVIEITHRATTRDLFALGAIRAAVWLAGRKPGWYEMKDTLEGD